MCLRLYNMTNILHWSSDTDVHLTYIRFGLILTQFYDKIYRCLRYRSTPGILRFPPIPPFIFPKFSHFIFVSALCICYRETTNFNNIFNSLIISYFSYIIDHTLKGTFDNIGHSVMIGWS